MILRPYQSKAIESLWTWFVKHPDGMPIMDCCVGSGKSLMIAATIRRAISEYPDTRVIVIAHQKELINQNLDKLLRIWPDADVGVYSAALGKKELGRTITYATIGSIYKNAHIMGSVQLVLCDECHLISTKEQGMWRTFIANMKKFGNPDIRVIGWTGTPFRNGGIWLTAGDDPLFTGIAARITMRDMLNQGYLAPLVTVSTTTRIDTSDTGIIAGDYNISELAKASDKVELVNAACDEIIHLAYGRKRMLVFAVNVEHAKHINDALNQRGVISAVVTGETPHAERDKMLIDYAQDRIRCMVSIGVLTTGFDQADIDFIALLRATRSPTLAIQMCGRGMRTAPGKIDCAFADFTDTIETLGAIDQITGRLPSKKTDGEAPYKLCPECGSRNAASALFCMDCNYAFPAPVRVNHGVKSSNASVLSSQQKSKIVDYEITDVRYSIHKKEGSPDSLRADYFCGSYLRVCSEWVCLSHSGFARAKAEFWWSKRAPREFLPGNTQQAFDWLQGGYELKKPIGIRVNETNKFPEIVEYKWSKENESTGTTRPTELLPA